MVEWWETFSQRPWVAHLLRAVERFNVRGGAQFAAAVAYFSVLSVVPILMLAFAGVGLTLTVLYPELLVFVEDWLKANLTNYGELGRALLGVVVGALSNWAALSLIAVGIALWTGISWVGNLKRAARALMREEYDRPPDQLPLPLDLLVNLGGLVALFLGLAVSWATAVAATTLWQQVGEWLGLTGPWWALLVRGVSLLVSLTAATLLFWVMFRWFALSPIRPKLLWIGSIVGAVGLVGLQTLAGYLIAAFSRNLTASLFGPVIILMLFFNLVATLILYVAAWLATAPAFDLEQPTEVATAAATPTESEPVKPGQEQVAAEVAQRSMGVGLVTGYAIGAATGLGLGAMIAKAVAAVFRQRRDR